MPELHPRDNRPILPFKTKASFCAWLEKHHANSPGIWIKFAKKNSGVASIVYPEALDVSLCFGWIDSQVASLDETFYLQRFTPRGPKSKWSKINCGKVESLIATGEMRPAGLRQIEAAKKDGRWEQAYQGQRDMKPPADFLSDLAKEPKAKKFFETLSGANRFAILYQIHDAKKPETRRRRIQKFIAMLIAGKTVH
jgi:uncharacterized protein YdeI (YjbR/CyaY-like superfamily)